MELTTIIGLVLGMGFIVYGILLDGELLSFYNLPSIAIVIGGTIAATIVSYPINKLKQLMPLVMMTFKTKKIDFDTIIEELIQMAVTARREGLLALEDKVQDTTDPFIRKGVMLSVDGTEPELVKDILETELASMEDRHRQGQAILTSMAGYAPAFGMIGTLIGLVNMLKKLDDPATLGPSMAVALVTTFYGVVLANLVFNPMVKKLKDKTEMEVLQKELQIEGILSILNGEDSRIIREKLTSFYTQKKKKEPKKADAKGNVEAEEE